MTPTIFESEQGAESLAYGGENLEDPIDPVEGAAVFVQKEQLASGDHVVVFGAGLGYRLHRLRELGCKDPIVFEPSDAVLALAKKHGPGIPEGVTLFTDLQELNRHLFGLSKPNDNTLLLCPPPYRRAFPEAYDGLTRVLDEVQGMVILRRNSIADRTVPMTEEALSNLPRLASVASIDALGRPLEGQPAFLVAAGPSLDRNRHLIERAGKCGAVFAVNTSAPALAAIDCPIDLLVSIEVLDVSAPIKAAAKVSRALALDLTSGGANYEAGIDNIVTFCADSSGYRQLADQLGLSVLPYGGSVATAAFALAARLGADPIVLLGQDLAYTDGRGYASDTLFEGTRVHRDGKILMIDRVAAWEEMTRAGGLRVPSKLRPCVEADAWGGEGIVWSTHELTLFRRWFEMAAQKLMGLTRLINATEGGASIKGFEEIGLEALLDTLPEVEHGLHEAIAAAQPLDATRVRDVAKGVASKSGELAAAAKRCRKALRRGDSRGLERATARLRQAASEARLAEAHAAPKLHEIMDDASIPSLEREHRTFAAIRASAERVQALARNAARAAR